MLKLAPCYTTDTTDELTNISNTVRIRFFTCALGILFNSALPSCRTVSGIASTGIALSSSASRSLTNGPRTPAMVSVKDENVSGDWYPSLILNASATAFP